MTLASLLSTPPSGRTRPVLIDDTDYSTAVIRQGSVIPWTDLGALAGHFGQVRSLLNSDAAWVDVARWQQAHLDGAAEIVAEMGARGRTGYALRSVLRHDGLLDEFTKAITTIADATRRGVVLALPSPGTWLARAHETAGTALDGVDLVDADSASMYVAEWLGHLGSLPVDLVVLDAASPPADLVESLADYTSITNVADHLGWTVVMRHPDRVESAGETRAAVLPAGYWEGTEPIPTDGSVLLTAIPSSASPEGVLDLLRALD